MEKEKESTDLQLKFVSIKQQSQNHIHTSGIRQQNPIIARMETIKRDPNRLKSIENEIRQIEVDTMETRDIPWEMREKSEGR